MEMTLTKAKALRALLDDRPAPRGVREMARELGIVASSLSAALAQLEADGHIEATWEHAGPPEARDRPARKFYRLTPGGLRFAVRELEALAAQLRPPPRAIRSLAAL